MRRPRTPTHELSAQARALLAGQVDWGVAYVAAPVSGDVPENLARARRWFVWLLARHPELALCMPWLAYCEVSDDQDEDARRRGIADDLVILARCDVIILVGGVLSPGMATELALAERLGLTVIDYLHLGDEPPGGGS